MDEQHRQQHLQAQRATLQLGTVHFDAGLDREERRGWVGTRDLGRPSMLGGPSGGLTVIVVPDRDEVISDQSIVEIPFSRVIKIEFEPYIP